MLEATQTADPAVLFETASGTVELRRAPEGFLYTWPRPSAEELAELYDLVTLEFREFGRNRLRRCAKLPGRKAGFEELHPVWQRDGDEVILFDTKRLISAGEAIGSRFKLRPGDCVAMMVNGNPVWLLARPMCHDAR